MNYKLWLNILVTFVSCSGGAFGATHNSMEFCVKEITRLGGAEAKVQQQAGKALRAAGHDIAIDVPHSTVTSQFTVSLLYAFSDLKFMPSITAVSVVHSQPQEIVIASTAANVRGSTHRRGKPIDGYYLLVSFRDAAARDRFLTDHKIESTLSRIEVGGAPSALIDPKFLTSSSLFSTATATTYEELLGSSDSQHSTSGGTTYFSKDGVVIGYGKSTTGFFISNAPTTSEPAFSSHFEIMKRQNRSQYEKARAAQDSSAEVAEVVESAASMAEKNLGLLRVELSQLTKISIPKKPELLSETIAMQAAASKILESLKSSDKMDALELGDELAQLARESYAFRLRELDLVRNAESREEFRILNDLVHVEDFNKGPPNGARVLSYVGIRTTDGVATFFAGQGELRHEHLAYILLHPLFQKESLDWIKLAPHFLGGVVAIQYDDKGNFKNTTSIQNYMSLFSIEKGRFMALNMSDDELLDATTELQRALKPSRKRKS